MAFGDFTVVRSTPKRVLNSSGVLASVAVNTPAFEFNADGTYKGLLVEPGATNLALQSETFGNATYTKVGGAVTDNTTVAPDGATTADTFTADGANSTHRLFQANSGVSGTTYTSSFYVKKGTADYVQIVVAGATPFGNTNFANFDILTGVVGTFGGNQFGSKIEALPNGWYRISSSITAIGTGAGQVDLAIVSSASAVRAESWTSSATVILWGAQFEASSVATSYMPTVASTANRTADSISLTGASSLIGQTAGTLFCEVSLRDYVPASLKLILGISDGTTANRISIRHTTDRRIQAVIVVANSVVANIFTATGQFGTFKIAVAYGTNIFKMYINGVEVTGTTSATVPACGEVYPAQIESSANTNQLNDHLEYFGLAGNAFSDAQLAEITS